ncbi:LysE family transporter [Thioclava sp. GXIMD2076]|uniref:LysE family transporter n=1 Tax=Thioclava kandeliae TaxID=3070818 RepID=A0ABV1SDA5_9RHOB
MTTITVFLAILGAVLLGAMSPGPSFVLISRLSLANSRRSGMAAAIGMGAGGAVFSVLALVGLIALLQQVEWLYWGLKVCGGTYLVFLGLKIWRHSRSVMVMAGTDSLQMPGAAKAKRQDFGSFGLGFVTQMANPKTAIVYASIFAAMLPENPERMLIFALPVAVFVVEAGWYGLVALVFSAPGPQQTYLRSKRWFDRAAGTVLALLGLRLIVEEMR